MSNTGIKAAKADYPNPIKALREACDFSLETVSKRMSLSRQYLIRAEQGCYRDPPVGVLNWLLNHAPEDFTYVTPDSSVDIGDFDLNAATNGYYSFQAATRKVNYDKLDPHFFVVEPKLRVLHPFVEWRMHSDITARIQISKMFCVHPALVHKFESQPHLCTSVPSELSYALRQSGYSASVVLALESEYEKFKRWMIEKHSISPGDKTSGLAAIAAVGA